MALVLGRLSSGGGGLVATVIREASISAWEVAVICVLELLGGPCRLGGGTDGLLIGVASML